jgi:hypothetical protein
MPYVSSVGRWDLFILLFPGAGYSGVDLYTVSLFTVVCIVDTISHGGGVATCISEFKHRGFADLYDARLNLNSWHLSTFSHFR